MAPSSDSTVPSGDSRQKSHVVMFPFMGQGHIIPFLQLSKLLAARTGFTITIVNTPLNVQALTPTIQSACQKDPSLDIRLAELPFSSAHHGLPPHTENTDSLPYSQVLTVLEAAEHLQPHFHNLIVKISEEDGRAPLCIISDMFLGWTQDVADIFGIPRIFFLTCGVYGTLLYYSMWNHLPHRNTDSEEFTLPDLPHVSLHRSQLPTNIKMATGTDPWSLFQARQISRNKRSWGSICNSFQQLEHRYLEHLGKSTGRPVWTVGPLLPPEFLSSTQSHDVSNELLQGKDATSDAISCLRWLNSQKVSSVIYVSFGSQNTISAWNMKELALGLESSGQLFIWVVRPPLGVSLTAEFSSDQFLPHGFEERIKAKDQGLVMKKWAPQRVILSHPSTGGFLSHCGWNSTLESVSQGVPMIGWPIAEEQYFNSKILEEDVGVCVEMCRGGEGELRKEKVERTVKMLMSEEKGRRMRERAAAMRDAARRAVMDGGEGIEKGSSMRDVDDMIQNILTTNCASQSL